MGLMDILNGMQNGPRGQPNPSSGSGGMSPITMAILGLLAYKAIKSFSDGQAPANQVNPNPVPSSGGGLGGLLSGGLGGLLAGGAAGSVLSGGLNDLLHQFQQSGHGEAANSWVGAGTNKSLSPDQMADALGADKINDLMAQTGMSRDDLLQGLSNHLPGVVDQLTPQGRLPSDDEASQLV